MTKMQPILSTLNIFGLYSKSCLYFPEICYIRLTLAGVEAESLYSRELFKPFRILPAHLGLYILLSLREIYAIVPEFLGSML